MEWLLDRDLPRTNAHIKAEKRVSQQHGGVPPRLLTESEQTSTPTLHLNIANFFAETSSGLQEVENYGGIPKCRL